MPAEFDSTVGLTIAGSSYRPAGPEGSFGKVVFRRDICMTSSSSIPQWQTDAGLPLKR